MNPKAVAEFWVGVGGLVEKVGGSRGSRERVVAADEFDPEAVIQSVKQSH